MGLISHYKKLYKHFLPRNLDFLEYEKHNDQYFYLNFIQELNNSVTRQIKPSLEFTENTWKLISMDVLSNEFIDFYEDKLDWTLLSQYQTISPNLLNKFKSKVNWEIALVHQKFTPEVIDKYFGFGLYLDKAFEHPLIPKNVLVLFKKFVDWTFIIQHRNFDLDFAKQVHEFIDWNLFDEYQNLSDEEIVEFNNAFGLNLQKKQSPYKHIVVRNKSYFKYFDAEKDLEDLDECVEQKRSPKNKIREFDWELMTKCTYLSPEFISHFSSELNWTLLSQYQILTPEIMDRYEYEIEWNCAFIHQNNIPKKIFEKLDLAKSQTESPMISNEFLIVFKKNISICDWVDILNRRHLTFEFIEQLCEGVNPFESFKTEVEEDPVQELQEEIMSALLCRPRNRGIVTFYEEWDYIATNVELTESFMNKYKDDVFWTALKYQTVSPELIDELMCDILDDQNSHILLKYQKISEDLIEKYQELKENCKDIELILKYQTHLSEEYKDSLRQICEKIKNERDAKWKKTDNSETSMLTTIKQKIGF